jgi:hypothetical protein
MKKRSLFRARVRNKRNREKEMKDSQMINPLDVSSIQTKGAK